jgi:hypothetical protein
LLNQPPHTPYSAAAVPGIDTIFTFWTIYFKIQTVVTWHCLGHHTEVIKCIMRGRVARYVSPKYGFFLSLEDKLLILLDFVEDEKSD